MSTSSGYSLYKIELGERTDTVSLKLTTAYQKDALQALSSNSHEAFANSYPETYVLKNPANELFTVGENERIARLTENDSLAQSIRAFEKAKAA